jgi:peroxiredoxin
MFDKKERIIITLTISISAIILTGVVIWAVVKKQPGRSAELSRSPENIQAEQQYQHNHEHLFEPLTESSDDVNQPKMSLNDIVRYARAWGPVFTSWYGKTAPDFTLTDITGKQHKLSDYRGKNVMIIFWATWCLPCLIEMPHLIALRNTIGEDKLAMLAISNENSTLVENFAAQKKISYPVFSSDTRAMPAPFNRIRGIPCSFFIGPEGKIKLATEGLLSLGEMKAIVQADSQMQ